MSKYYKIVNPAGHHGVKYRNGLNTDPLPFNPSGNCEPGGIYFSDAANVLAFAGYGSDIYEVEPVGPIYENPGPPKKFKAHALKMRRLGRWADVKVFRELLASGVKPTSDTLTCAAKSGSVAMVKLILAAGGKPNSNTLAYATWAGSAGVVKLLLAAGAKPIDYTLDCAAESGSVAVVKIILAAGVRPTSDTLAYATWAGSAAVVKLLLAAGGKPNSNTLACAAKSGSVAMVKLIKKAMEI